MIAVFYAELLDQCLYHCSIRTMCRILHENGEVKERRRQLRHPTYTKPELIAEGPNKVWSWDITKLMGPAKWTYFYLYVNIDIFSRRVMAWRVADAESAALFKPLFEDATAKHGVLPGQLTVHADRGATIKAKATALLLADLGVTKSHSRPHTSNDNPFSESLFKNLQISAPVPPRLRLHPGRQGLLPPVLQLVQLRPPLSRNRPDDAKPGQLRTGRRGLCRTTENPRQSLRRQSKCFVKKPPNHRKSQPPFASIRPKASSKSKPKLSSPTSRYR